VTPDALAVAPQAVIGRYQVREKLGSGAFGSVYRAYDPQLDREIALKILRPEALSSPLAVERFRREARAAAKMHHPHIVPVHDAGQHGKHFFIASAFIRGRTLASAIPEEGLDQRRTAQLALQLVEALAYAHQQGVLHRDVKPANIMVDDQDNLYLMDFGLAGWAEQASTRLTEAGVVMGTPAYMAPEQARGDVRQVGPAADLYSAGVVLYEMLTGRVPFEGSLAMVLFNVVRAPPPPPSRHRPGLDPRLEAICLKALAKQTAERYLSGQEMAAALQGWLQGQESRPLLNLPAAPRPQPAPPTMGRAHPPGSSPDEGREKVVHSPVAKSLSLPTPLADAVSEPGSVVPIGGGPRKQRSRSSGVPSRRGRLQEAGAELDEAQPHGPLQERRPWLLTAGVVVAGALGLAVLLFPIRFPWRSEVPPPDLRADIEECLKLNRIGKSGSPYIEKAAPLRIAVWRAAAEQGSPEGQFLLSRCLELGAGTAKNDAEAIQWCRKAADQGYPLAQHNLGARSVTGEGVARDEVAAAQWYRKAADQGFVWSQHNLGDCYRDGRGVPKDVTEAVKWYRKAAGQGFPPAQNNLGACSANAWGVPKDEAEAVKWYRKAAEQGNPEAQFNLGLCHEKGQGVPRDDKEAVGWYRKAAEQNNAPGQNNLGNCYLHGRGLTKDDKEAVKWFRKAIEQNNANAQNNLGDCYFNAWGVPRDEREAVEWFRKAAHQGNDLAQNSLGICHANGWGVSKDDSEAVKWYRQAADQGLALAQFSLGCCYHNGQGVPSDEEEAVKWYRQAADQGNDLAQYNLGACYDKGQGVPNDKTEAVKWYRKAADQGNARAKERLKKLAGKEK